MKRGKREHPKKERYIGIGHRNRADSVKIRGLEVVGKEEYTEVARSKGKGGRVDIGLISKGRKEEARLLKLELENDVMTDAERREKTEKWKGLAYKREYWRMSPAQKKTLTLQLGWLELAAEKLMPDGLLWRNVLTIAAQPGSVHPEFLVDTLRAHYVSWVKRWKRAKKRGECEHLIGPAYCWVIEAQTNGNPHLNVLGLACEHVRGMAAEENEMWFTFAESAGCANAGAEVWLRTRATKQETVQRAGLRSWAGYMQREFGKEAQKSFEMWESLPVAPGSTETLDKPVVAQWSGLMGMAGIKRAAKDAGVSFEEEVPLCPELSEMLIRGLANLNDKTGKPYRRQRHTLYESIRRWMVQWSRGRKSGECTHGMGSEHDVAIYGTAKYKGLLDRLSDIEDWYKRRKAKRGRRSSPVFAQGMPREVMDG